MVVVTFVAIAISPGVGLVTAFCTFGFETIMQTRDVFFATHATLINYISGGLVLWALIVAMLRGRTNLRSIGSTELLILGFYLLLVSTYIWAVSQTWWYSTLDYAAPYTVAYVFLLPLIFGKSRDLETGMKAVVYSGTVIIVILLLFTRLHEWGRSFKIESMVIDRFGEEKTGAQGHGIATLAAEVAMFTFFLTWRRAQTIWLAARAALMVLACAMIIRTDSRGPLFMLIICTLVFAPIRWPKLDTRLLIGVPLAALILGIGVYWGASFSVHAWRWAPDRMIEDFQTGRIDLSAAVLKEWLRGSPWQILFGLGAGASFHYIGIYPHVLVVQILCETGIVGLVIHLATLAVTFLNLKKLLKLSKNDERLRGLTCALGAVFVFRWSMTFKAGGIEGIYELFLLSLLIAKLVSSEFRQVAANRRHALGFGGGLAAPGLAAPGLASPGMASMAGSSS